MGKNSKPHKHPQKRRSGASQKGKSLTIKSFFAEEKKSLIDMARIVGVDCEMVETVEGKDVLARVSVVSYSGKVLVDLFVKPDIAIRDYRTDVTGVDAELLAKSGLPHSQVLAQISALLKDKIVVGHGLNNDFQVLEISHPEISRRDTAGYKGLRPVGREDKVPALRTLVALHLQKTIQQGVHSSIEDARCALSLYKKVATDWETQVRQVTKTAKHTDAASKRLVRKARRDGVKRATKRTRKEQLVKATLDDAL